MPWSICRGIIGQHLADLQPKERPSNSQIGGKAWDSLQLGLPSHVLVRMFEVLGDVPWTTRVAEQLHGSAAVVSRFHPEYELDTLLSRSQLLTLAKLLPKPTAKQHKVIKIRMALSKVSRKNPDKACSRQLYFGDLCKVAATKYATDKLPGIRKKVMKMHAKKFAQYSDTVRTAYARRARVKATEKKKQSFCNKGKASGKISMKL